jgi:arylsulfatase A-like enzyme
MDRNHMPLQYMGIGLCSGSGASALATPLYPVYKCMGRDSAGQNLGSDGYIQTVQAPDAPLGGLAQAYREQNVLLAVTADHGMVFGAPGKVKGGNSAEKYSSSLESRRMPLVVIGPGTENFSLNGVWSEESIVPTILELLDIAGPLSASKAALPSRIAAAFD